MVPAWNEAGYLGATLASIHAAARALSIAYEIVVADDGSTDATAEIARRGGARVVVVAHRQIAATRNAGARSALGERLAFVDADTRVDAALVRAALAALDAGAIGGGCAVRFEEGAPAWAAAILWFTVRLFRTTRLAAGCFVFCTRAGFEAVGGFDEAYFGAEEIVLSRALKRRGRFVVLREAVTTSARKSAQGWQLLAVALRVLLRGPSVIRRREGMDFWYRK